MSKNKFKTNLAALRKKAGHTQASFADKINVKRSIVSAYEEGRAMPKYDRLIEIADFFNVSLDDILICDCTI